MKTIIPTARAIVAAVSEALTTWSVQEFGWGTVWTHPDGRREVAYLLDREEIHLYDRGLQATIGFNQWRDDCDVIADPTSRGVAVALRRIQVI